MNKKTFDDLEGIEKYLLANFKKPARGFLAKIFGESSNYSYKITKTEEHESNQDFTKLNLLWVAVNDCYLDMSYMPSSETWGLFAVNKDTCLHLAITKLENLSKALEIESNLDNISASSLAKLFCSVCLNDKINMHKVIENFKEVLDVANQTAGYVMNNNRVIIPPASIEKKEKEIILKFHTLQNWLSKNNKINEVIVNIKKDFTYTLSTATVYKKIFSGTANLRY